MRMEICFIKWCSVYNQLNIGVIPGNIVLFHNSDILGSVRIHYSKTKCLQENIEYFGKQLKEKNQGKIDNIGDKEFDINESIKFGCKNELFYLTNDQDFLQKGGNLFFVMFIRALVRILPYVINPSSKEIGYFKKIEATSLDCLTKKEIHICEEFLNEHFDFLLAWRKLVKSSNLS